VTPHMVEAPRLIQRGQEVTLVVEGTALAVRAKGTALGDAAEGERVQVRNSSSQEVVEGVVRGRGIVAVSL
jgi:flagella basal body P-ring formation protein FlgA